MKYEIDEDGDLWVYNEDNYDIFLYLTPGAWIKYDYDQNGMEIYRENGNENEYAI